MNRKGTFGYSIGKHHPLPAPPMIEMKFLTALTVVLAALFLCSCAGGSGVHVKIGGVETVSREPLEPLKWTQKGQQLSFCMTKGDMDNRFQSRNRSLMDTDYYSRHLADYFRKDTPFESIETVGDDTEDLECDILLYPSTVIYVTPLSRIEVIMSVSAKAVKQAGVSMGAWVLNEPSVETAGSRLGRVVYNAFAPGTPLYDQVAPYKAGAAKAFETEAARYRTLPVKPALPEEARKYKVQAEAAVKRKSFGEAAERYRDALKVAPWWPEGHFNRALILGETGEYKKAIGEMKKYLILVPDAPDVRAAQDKIYEWEGLARKSEGGAKK